MKRYWALCYAVTFALVVACGGGGTTSTPIADPTLEATPVPQEAPTLRETPTQDSTPRPNNLGRLEFRVTAQPIDNVSSILVTLKDIEVHFSGGEEMSGWRKVVEKTHRVDLKELTDVEEVLGSATLESGRYQQVRFEVVDVVITVRGRPRQAPVPSGKLRLVGGFDVSAGAKTIVTLDIDAEKSVVLRAGQGPQLNPVVKMLVRKGGQPLSEARVVASLGPDDDRTTVE